MIFRHRKPATKPSPHSCARFPNIGAYILGLVRDSLATELNILTVSVKNDVANGKGTVHALLKDSALVQKLSNSLQNIEQGTDGFNQNMEALKNNFLLRGYFKKQERKKKQ
ncbi:MAG: hypothetical protein ACOVP7_11640 [Lacibacter sp.]